MKVYCKSEIYIDECVKKIFDQFSKVQHYTYHYIARETPIPESPLIMDGRKNTKIILNQDQLSGIFPHPSIYYHCCFCSTPVASETIYNHMMHLTNCPTPIFPMCYKCRNKL